MILTQLLIKELLFLGLAFSIGSGLLPLLHEFPDRLCRWLLVPILGVCIAVDFFTSLNWFWPAEDLGWLVPALAVISVASLSVTKRRRRPEERAATPSQSTRWGGAVQIALVVAILLIPPTLALWHQSSGGPVAYQVYDAAGYVAEADSAQIESIDAAAHRDQPASNLLDGYYTHYLHTTQQLDLTAYEASIDALTGWGATSTQSPFMLAMMALGGLGAFATIRLLLRRRSWFAVLGGALFGGPFFLQLFFDGSQGAICGLALLLPFLMVIHRTSTQPTTANLALSAVLLSGIAGLYPNILLPTAAAIAAAILFAVLRGRATFSRRDFLRWVKRIALVLGGAAALDLFAAQRLLRLTYYLSRHREVLAGFPPYHLGYGVVLSWLAQTRGLYSVAFGAQSPFADLLPGLLIPLAVVVALIAPLRRMRLPWLMLIFLAVTVIAGAFEAVHNSCGYCENRSLILAEPVAILAIAIGLCGLFHSAGRFQRIGAVAIAAVFLAAIGVNSFREWRLFTDHSYFLPAADYQVLGALPRSPGSVEVEGFGEGDGAAAEEPLVYALVSEATDGHVSLFTDKDDRLGLSYLGLPHAAAVFNPRYNLVFTRLPSISTDRTRIATGPSLALERRGQPLDVSLDYGVAVPLLPSEDPLGDSWIAGPLRLVVTGALRGPVYVRVGANLPSVTTPITPQVGVTLSRQGAVVTACRLATGGSLSRAAEFSLPPNIGVLVTAMSASTRPCT